MVCQISISHINGNYGRESAVLNLIELKQIKADPYLDQHILLYSNGLAIWQGLPDIKHMKVNYGR